MADLSARKKQLIERKDQTKLLVAELSELIDTFKDQLHYDVIKY